MTDPAPDQAPFADVSAALLPETLGVGIVYVDTQSEPGGPVESLPAVILDAAGRINGTSDTAAVQMLLGTEAAIELAAGLVLVLVNLSPGAAASLVQQVVNGSVPRSPEPPTSWHPRPTGGIAPPGATGC